MEIQKMKIELEVPEGKVAEWVNGVLTLVDEEKPKNVMERIKTFEDAVSELGEGNKLVQAYNAWESGGVNNQADIDAYLKLRIVVAALNEGWKPKFMTDEYRYYPYFYLYTKEEVEGMDEEKRKELWLLGGSSNSGAACGLSVSHSPSIWAYSRADVSARLSLKSEELAEYCGKQFQSIWADYVHWCEG